MPTLWSDKKPKRETLPPRKWWRCSCGLWHEPTKRECGRCGERRG